MNVGMHRLIDALLDTPEKRNAYRREAEFYHGINMLARVLPRFVDLMVEDSHAAEKHRQEMVRLAESGLGPGFRIDPLGHPPD